MTPVRYRWDRYAERKQPGPWYSATTGMLQRACRALTMPSERLRVQFDTGQEVVFKRAYGRTG